MGISLTGLASGLDTSAMIEGLMKLERMPLVNMEAHRKDLGNQQSVLRSINTKMTALKTAISDLMYTSSFNIAGGVSSNTGVVNIKTSDNAAHGVYNVKVTSIATNHVVKSNSIAANGINLASNVDRVFKVHHGGQSFEVKLTAAEDTNEKVLNSIASQINSQGGSITASVIETTSGNLTLTFSSKETGTAGQITTGNTSDGKKTVLEDSDGILLALGIVSGAGVQNANEAKDAVFEVNGISVTRSSNEVSDVIQGVTLNLQSSGDSTITVKSDNNKIAEKVEAFVKAYNEVATLINDNLGKEKLLQSNSTVRSLDMQLKSMINELVGSEPGFKLLSEIGLEIDKGIVDPKLMTGKINFDKEKFLQKLGENPNAVAEMFIKQETGLTDRMDKMLGDWTNSVDGMLTVAIKGYQSNIDLVDENMQRLLERLDKREEALQKQFAAMEVALSNLKNQQNWLAGQLNQLMTPINNNSK